MKTLDILDTAEISPLGSMGGGRKVRNRDDLVKKLAIHRRVRLIWIGAILFMILGIFIFGIWQSITNPVQDTKGLVPYLGGSTFFIALLKFGYSMVKDYAEGDLPLLVLEHGTDSQVAEFLDALKEAQRYRKSKK